MSDTLFAHELIAGGRLAMRMLLDPKTLARSLSFFVREFIYDPFQIDRVALYRIERRGSNRTLTPILNTNVNGNLPLLERCPLSESNIRDLLESDPSVIYTPTPGVGSDCWIRRGTYVIAFDDTTSERSFEVDEVRVLIEAAEMLAEVVICKEFLEQMRHDRTHDELTGMQNRRGIFDRIKVVLETLRLGSEQASVSLLFMDLNGFKPVNDTWGHDAGDAILVRTAELIIKWWGATDTGRLGGDEFLVCIDGSPTDRLSEFLATYAKEELSWKNDKGTEIIIPFSGISIGVINVTSAEAQKLQREGDLEALVAAADKMMYEAKGEGKTAGTTDSTVVTGTFQPIPVPPSGTGRHGSETSGKIDTTN